MFISLKHCIHVRESRCCNADDSASAFITMQIVSAWAGKHAHTYSISILSYTEGKIRGKITVTETNI